MDLSTQTALAGKDAAGKAAEASAPHSSVFLRWVKDVGVLPLFRYFYLSLS